MRDVWVKSMIIMLMLAKKIVSLRVMPIVAIRRGGYDMWRHGCMMKK